MQGPKIRRDCPEHTWYCACLGSCDGHSIMTELLLKAVKPSSGQMQASQLVCQPRASYSRWQAVTGGQQGQVACKHLLTSAQKLWRSSTGQQPGNWAAVASATSAPEASWATPACQGVIHTSRRGASVILSAFKGHISDGPIALEVTWRDLIRS